MGKGEPKDYREHPFERDPDFQEEFSHVVSNDDVTGADDDFLPEVFDETYLSMELATPKRGETETRFALLNKPLRDVNGLPIGKARDNPILDTRMYEVGYADGENFSLSANLIAEKTIAQIYEEGNRHVLMDKITDHRFDEAAVKSGDIFVTTSYRTKPRRNTIQGVSLCIKWRDGNTT